MKKQIRSFLCAFIGFFSAIRTESHLRFHMVAAFYVIFLASLGDFTPAMWAILSIIVGIVIFAELINTALEDLCDLYSTEYNLKIKRIKDISAAAVLITAVASIFVALSIFVFTGNVTIILERLCCEPMWFIPLGISVPASLCFLFLVGRNKDNKNNKK